MRWKDRLGVDQCSRGLASCVSSCWPTFCFSQGCAGQFQAHGNHPTRRAHHESLQVCLRISSKAARTPWACLQVQPPHASQFTQQLALNQGQASSKCPSPAAVGAIPDGFLCSPESPGRLKTRCPSQRSQYCALSGFSTFPVSIPLLLPSWCFVRTLK